MGRSWSLVRVRIITEICPREALRTNAPRDFLVTSSLQANQVSEAFIVRITITITCMERKRTSRDTIVTNKPNMIRRRSRVAIVVVLIEFATRAAWNRIVIRSLLTKQASSAGKNRVCELKDNMSISTENIYSHFVSLTRVGSHCPNHSHLGTSPSRSNRLPRAEGE